MRKRTDFEYVLKRRHLTPNDFITYLKYELNLEKLRELRCQRFEEGSQTREEKDAIRNIKSSFSRHVCYIFDRALRRFPSEVSIWADYIDYLKKSNANAALNTALGRAIALFPKDENMWIEAAAHEMSNNNSAETSRKLLQRALRVNKTSQRLWRRYFELELWNVARISNRKKILKIEEDESAKERLRILSAPLVVFRYAVAAIPNPEFAYELYDLAIAVSEEVGGSIMEEMKKTLGHLSAMWAHIVTADMGKKIRTLSMAKTEDASSCTEETANSAPTLLTKFAELATVLIDGMELFESGLGRFAIDAGAVAAISDVPPSSKKRKSKDNDIDTSKTQMVSETCTDDDLCMFLESFAKIIQVCIGGVSAVYAESFSEATEQSASHIVAAFRVLDGGLIAVRRVLQRLMLQSSESAGVNTDIDCMLALCRYRLGVLLQFSDYFSDKWIAVLNADIGGSKSKKRKSVSISGETREALANRDVIMDFVDVKEWLSASVIAQRDRCDKAGGAPVAPLSHVYIRVAATVLTYMSTALEHCQEPIYDVDISCPGDFWWSVLLTFQSVDALAVAADDVSKVVCHAAEVNFSTPSNVGKDTVFSVVSKGQTLLLRNSNMSAICDRKKFVLFSLQRAIRSRYITAENRMLWLCEYIKLSYGSFHDAIAVISDENLTAGRAAYKWCFQTLNSMPGILHLHSKGTDNTTLGILYEQIFEIEGVNEFIEERNKRGYKVVDSATTAKINFLNGVFESALRHCPDDESILALSADYYGAIGDHKRANHLRWKKNNMVA